MIWTGFQFAIGLMLALLAAVVAVFVFFIAVGLGFCVYDHISSRRRTGEWRYGTLGYYWLRKHFPHKGDDK